MSPTTPVFPATDIQVVATNEAYEEIDGRSQFASTRVVYRHSKHLYHGVSKKRNVVASELDITQLTNKIPIPFTAYTPAFPPTYTQAPDPLPPNIYVKKPYLLSYDRISRGSTPKLIADNVLAEVRVCELLKRNPHPNIARYIGCQVEDGRIKGICFQKYEKTVMEISNPRGFGKREFMQKRQDLGDYSQQFEFVRAGLRHLHSLGLVHNDLNPSNIMVEGDEWVIVDFDSCRHVGVSLEHVGRTYEWHDEAVKTSVEENDWGALREIVTWLSGTTEDLQFDA